eukprot:358007-Chlamydomonas_euryale.AAC.1
MHAREAILSTQYKDQNLGAYLGRCTWYSLVGVLCHSKDPIGHESRRRMVKQEARTTPRRRTHTRTHLSPPPSSGRMFTSRIAALGSTTATARSASSSLSR